MSRHLPRTVLVTGGAGFIGGHFVRHLLSTDPHLRIINIDALTYAGNSSSLADIVERFPNRHRFIHGNITDASCIETIFAEEGPDTVVHFAAESHVDRSIDGPAAFLNTNIQGTFVLLEAARRFWKGRSDVRFHHISTDEVFGSLGEQGAFSEESPYDPSSPYSASKAAADHLVRAWGRTYDFPYTLSNCSNNYGPYQFPEKLIPLMILKALRNERLPIYGTGQNIRDWLYVIDHVEAIDQILRHADTGTTWLVGGRNEWTNLQIVETICERLDTLLPTSSPRKSLMNFVPDRPGHDQRYAIDPSRLEQQLGWRPRHDFSSGLSATIQWYLDSTEWVENITSGNYRFERLGSSSFRRAL